MKNKPYVIAEIGCNHKGDLRIAKTMIERAKVFCNADAVKFQKRNPRELLTRDEFDKPHPNPENAYGATYGLHREALEFSLQQHRELQAYCTDMGITYSSSVWDMTSTKEIMSLSPEFIKIPSATNLDFNILNHLTDYYSGKIHLSLGMTTREEEEKILNFFISKQRNKDLILYSCVSGYPVRFEDLSLLEINRLKDNYAEIVGGIGFSGHHLGIAADIAALALGAQYFERHFTLDRTWKGTDHAASLEPDGLRRLIRDLNHVSLGLTYKKEEILDVEKSQRAKLKRENHG